jgi:hypothetical protein
MARFHITSCQEDYLCSLRAYDILEVALKEIMQSVHESIQTRIQQPDFDFQARNWSGIGLPTVVFMCLVDAEAGSALFEISTMSKHGASEAEDVYDGYKYADRDKFLLLSWPEEDDSKGEILREFDTLREGLTVVKNCLREYTVQKIASSFRLVKGRTDLCEVRMFPYPIRRMVSRFDYPPYGPRWSIDSVAVIR